VMYITIDLCLEVLHTALIIVSRGFVNVLCFSENLIKCWIFLWTLKTALSFIYLFILQLFKETCRSFTEWFPAARNLL
jgi:hypothetical protein